MLLKADFLQAQSRSTCQCLLTRLNVLKKIFFLTVHPEFYLFWKPVDILADESVQPLEVYT